MHYRSIFHSLFLLFDQLWVWHCPVTLCASVLYISYDRSLDCCRHNMDRHVIERKKIMQMWRALNQVLGQRRDVKQGYKWVIAFMIFQIWLRGSDVCQLTAQDVWKGKQHMQIRSSPSQGVTPEPLCPVLPGAVQPAGLALCCLSEWEASVHYVIISIWVATELPHHCTVEPKYCQVNFLTQLFYLSKKTFFHLQLPEEEVIQQLTAERFIFLCSLVILGQRALCVLCTVPWDRSSDTTKITGIWDSLRQLHKSWTVVLSSH